MQVQGTKLSHTLGKCCFLSGLRLAQYLWLATPKDAYSLWNTAVQDIIFQDLKKVGLQRAWNKIV